MHRKHICLAYAVRSAIQISIYNTISALFIDVFDSVIKGSTKTRLLVKVLRFSPCSISASAEETPACK